jgi:hypothetical protein
VRTFTIDERRKRLARRHFLSASDSPPMTRIIAGLVGLHATDPTTPYLSLWARSPGFVTADLEGGHYQKRSAVRHLAMRRNTVTGDQR